MLLLQVHPCMQPLVSPWFPGTVLVSLSSALLCSPNTTSPARHPLIHSVWVPQLYALELVLAVRFLLRSAGSRYHRLLTGMFLINALMMQKSSDFSIPYKSSDFSIPYTFVHPKGRTRNGSDPRTPGCCCQSCWLFYLKSF